MRNRKVRRHRHDERYVLTERALILVFVESQALFTWLPVDKEHISRLHLCRPQQPRERGDHMALDRALQVARPISLVRPFFEQELPSFVRYSEREGDRRRIEHPFLYLRELDLQHIGKLLLLQWVKHHDVVQTVHKLG